MRQTGFTAIFFLFASLSSIPLSAQVPPGTGAGGTGTFTDPNFQIVTETLSPHETAGCSSPTSLCPPTPVQAWVVSKLAGWAPALSGSQWIAPDPDQSNATRNGSYLGSVTYQTQFNATPALTLNVRVLADDNVVVSLNGNNSPPAFTSTGGQYLFAGMFQMTGFKSGTNANIVTFVVSNAGGGPTGLDVAFADASAPPSGPALALNYPAYPDAMTFSSTAVGATSAQTLYLINNGDTAATFAAIGPPTGSFSIDPTTQSCGAPLGAGSYCSFNVVFAPTSATPASQTGTLKISLQGPASTYTVNLAGTSAAASAGPPSLTYSPASLVFPATPITTTTSAEQLVEITNCAGCMPAIFSDLLLPTHFTIDWTPSTAVPPPNGIPFCSSITDDPTHNLAAGASCVVGVAFKPTTATVVTDSFGIDLLCGPPCLGQVFTLPLIGTGGNGPVLIFSPNPMVFPTPVPPGSIGSAPIVVTVTNTGNAIGTISGLPGAPGTPVTAFHLDATTCTPSIPAPSPPPAAYPTCTMTFSFRPPAGTPAGVLKADPLATPPNPLTVYLAPNDEFAFSLSAVGTVGAAAANGPAFGVSPNPMNFSVAVNDQTGALLTITNSGNAPLNITSYTFGSSHAFGYGSDCIGTIQPGANCTQNVTFHPSSVGTVTDSFVIHDDRDVPALQQTVTLIGVGLGPAVSLDGATCPLTAGTSCETLRMFATGTSGGTTSPVQTVTLKNTGTADLHIYNVQVNGSSTGFSKVNDTCLGQTISGQGGTCSLQFTFNASVVGPSQTTVTITDDATPTTQTITLLGGITGPAIIVTPNTNFTFSANVNQKVSTNITLTNVGSVDIAIQNIKLATNENGFSLGDLTSCFSPALGAAGNAGQLGGSCTFPVNFDPASAGSFTNSIVITTNPSLPVTITLTGAAVAGFTAPPQQFCQAGVCVTMRAYRDGSAPAATDPVDGASGQFYEDDLDLSLGGPLNLQFARFYGSGLSSGAFQSSLGVNWMSNFDVTMALNNNTAQVLLFRGKTVNFSNAGGTWTLVSPADIGYQFAAAGSGYQFMSPVSGLVYTFDSSGRLAGIADLKGNALTVTQGPNGPTSISDGLGRTLTLTYSAGNLASVQDQAGRSVSYSYTGVNLTSSTDALKKTTQYTYTTAGPFAGLMTKKQLPVGNIPTIQTYDGSGRVTAQTDGNGNALQIGYDGAGGTTITGALGDVTLQGNNASGDLGKMTDPAGKSLNVTFDSAERRTSLTDKLGNAANFTYHAPTGNIASRTDELGNTTTYSYTARVQGSFTYYDLTGIAFPDGTSASMSYDPNGNLTSRTAADGTTATKTYDSNGRLLTATDANKQTTSFVYNSDGTMASSRDPLGNLVAYTYTPAGQPSKITDPNSGVSTFTYDADGRQLTSADPAGAVSSSRYDDNGRRVGDTNQVGGTIGYTYSPTGKLTSITDPLGNKTTYTYDKEDRQTSVTDAAGETLSRTYDSVGHLLSLSDNGGPRVNYTYDAEGRILSQTDPTGKVIGFGYGPTGELMSSTKPDGTKYTFTYDKVGRLLSLTNPLGETQSVKRDAMGRITQINLPGGLTSAIQLDTLGRTSAITSPNGNTWTIGNDALGRIAGITDPLGKATTRSYTGMQLTGMALPLGTLALTRDKDGRVTQRKYSDGTTINAAYDPMGLLTSADGLAIQRDTAGRAVNMNGIALTYTTAGRLATLTYASGKTVTYAYDSAGRLASVSDWVGGQTAFTYDAASRLTGMTYPNGVATAYTFDANGRLAGIAAGGLSSIALTRDADGKIVSAVRNLPTAPALQSSSRQFSYNAAAQMNGEDVDAMGRALSETGRTYTWNLASQLTGFRDSANSGALTYDALGELASSAISGLSKTFVFNYAAALPALSIVRQGGSDLRYYVYTPAGAPLYSIEASGNARKFYHFDEMGNTALLTGDNGAIADTYAVTPYGDIADHVGPTDNPFTWQGQYGVIQESNGLYFMRQRHYDASASRFLSPDPLTTADPRSAEPYTYARGNPLFYVDPTGALTWVQISFYQVAVSNAHGLRVDDSHVPTLAEASSLGLSLLDANSLAMFNLIRNHPGVNWGDLHNFAVDAPTQPAIQPAASNANALASCNKTRGLCPNGAVTQLTNLVLAGQGGSVESAAISAMISQDGSTLIGNDGSSLVGNDGSSLVGNDGSSLIGTDGRSLIGNDGSSLIGNDGSSLIGAGSSTLIGDGGSTLVSNASGTLVGPSGGTLISNDGGSVISNDGGSVISNDGGSLVGNLGS